MKILFIITQSEIGGAQRFLLEFAPYLQSRGHEIIVAAGEGDGELFKQLDIKLSGPDPVNVGVRPRQINIPSLVRSLNPKKDIKALFALYKVIKTEKPDILFLQSTKAGFLGALAARLLGFNSNSAAGVKSQQCPKTIYRIGGWSFQDPRPWWMNQILFWMEKISAPWKDVIIVNSEFDKQLAIEKKITQAYKIVKIYNGIAADSLKFLERNDARNVLQSRIMNRELGDKILIGTIANLYATKGIEHLIDAARILSAIHNTPYTIQFLVIGEGPERPKLDALIKKHNLENNFFLVGRMKNAAQYLKAFDIFVLPSVKEGFPWALLEAMAAGVPIISANVGAVAEIIEDQKDGLLIPPFDSRALAEKIQTLIQRFTPYAALDYGNHYTRDREYYIKNAKMKLKEFSLKKMLIESERVTFYDTLEL